MMFSTLFFGFESFTFSGLQRQYFAHRKLSFLKFLNCHFFFFNCLEVKFSYICFVLKKKGVKKKEMCKQGVKKKIVNCDMENEN